MLNILLIRPGATEFDEQFRIKGSLDMPLSDSGREQARHTAQDLAGVKLDAIYTAGCESATATASIIAADREIKIKSIANFCNVDHGLWHGKLVEEVKRQQPRVYRQGEDNPTLICPPGGETIETARSRVTKAINKILKKHRSGNIAFVISDPLASVAHSVLSGTTPKSLWGSEIDSCTWDQIKLGDNVALPEAILT